MSTEYPQEKRPSSPSRHSIRLTFHITEGEAEIIATERLRMVTPPSIGELPIAGTHGGYWVELRNDKGDVIFHRIINNPIQSSAEIFSPDGRIERLFDKAKAQTFEVLIPDTAAGRTIALMGETLSETKSSRRKKAPDSRELAQFTLFEDEKGQEE